MKTKIMLLFSLICAAKTYAEETISVITCFHNRGQHVDPGPYRAVRAIRLSAIKGEFYIFTIEGASYSECPRPIFAGKISDLGDLPEYSNWPTTEAEFVGAAQAHKSNGFGAELLVFKPAGKKIESDKFTRVPSDWKMPDQKGRSFFKKWLGK